MSLSPPKRTGSLSPMSAEPSSGRSSSSSASGGMADPGKANNLQRIQQKKHQIRRCPRNKKLEKLALYSSCKVSVS